MIEAILCAAVSAWVVFVARIGPVVAVLTPTHGVHAGDVLAVPCLVLGALAARRDLQLAFRRT
jgi:hypothetical protein